jgi:N-acetylmuramic acid 6-phosphate etherase
VDRQLAEKILNAAQNNVKAAIVMIKNGVDYETALKRLERSNGYVREAID